MRFVKWLKRERISIDEIEIRNPEKEFKSFMAYSVFFIFIVLIFSVIIKVCPIPILGAVDKLDDMWYVCFVKIVFLLIVPLCIYKKSGYEIRSLFNFEFNRKLKNIFAVLISFTVGFFINSSIMRVIQTRSLYPDLHTLLWIFAAALIPLIAAAIPEEVFYRAILQTRIEKRSGWLAGILISAVLFALFHFPSRMLLASGVEGTAGNILSVSLGTLAPVFLMGIIFGLLWKRYRNIYLLVALHYGIDLLPPIASFMGIKL